MADEPRGPRGRLGRTWADLGTPVELVKHFGGREAYLAAVRDLEAELYRAAA